VNEIVTFATVKGQLPPVESDLLGLVVSVLSDPVVLTLLILGLLAASAWLMPQLAPGNTFDATSGVDTGQPAPIHPAQAPMNDLLKRDISSNIPTGDRRREHRAGS
jgi:hypothetical protein